MAHWAKTMGVVFAGAALMFACGIAAGQDAEPDKPLTVEEWIEAKNLLKEIVNNWQTLAHIAAKEGRIDVLERL